MDDGLELDGTDDGVWHVNRVIMHESCINLDGTVE